MLTSMLSEFSLADPNAKWWIMIAFGGATILYAVFRPSSRKKDPLAKSPSWRSLSQQRNVERQMETLLVELSEMARQMSAQLDTRCQKLEILLQQADEKIARLQESPGSVSSPAPVSTPVSEQQQHREIYELADRGSDAPEIARQLNRPRGEVELILALRGRG